MLALKVSPSNFPRRAGLLWVLLIGAHTVDILSTQVALHVQMGERNPLGNWMLSTGGFTLAALIKIGLTGTLAILVARIVYLRGGQKIQTFYLRAMIFAVGALLLAAGFNCFQALLTTSVASGISHVLVSAVFGLRGFWGLY